jgi:hypothetical protein
VCMIHMHVQVSAAVLMLCSNCTVVACSSDSTTCAAGKYSLLKLLCLSTYASTTAMLLTLGKHAGYVVQQHRGLDI